MRVTSWLPMNVSGEPRSGTRCAAAMPSPVRRNCRRSGHSRSLSTTRTVSPSRTGFADYRRVVPVNQLADEPRLRMPLADLGQHLGPERLRHSVSRIQSPAVGPAAQPVRHDVDDVVGDLRIAVVQRNEIAVTFKSVKTPRTSAEPPARLVAVLHSLPVTRELQTHMVEHPVEQDTQPAPVRLGYRWSKSSSSPRRGSMR